ncbi:hypothetical protein IFM47457_05785 [Aspergillus lentulus]|nr:hypothetical protein IFM47457_05785 [Aspergillus lentulus]
MSLLGFASELVGMLNTLKAVLSVADKALLQIYCAGLIFMPLEVMVRREFQKELPSWLRTGGAQNYRLLRAIQLRFSQ